MTNINFLLATSIRYQKKRLWGLTEWSVQGNVERSVWIICKRLSGLKGSSAADGRTWRWILNRLQSTGNYNSYHIQYNGKYLTNNFGNRPHTQAKLHVYFVLHVMSAFCTMNLVILPMAATSLGRTLKAYQEVRSLYSTDQYLPMLVKDRAIMTGIKRKLWQQWHLTKN